MPDLPIQVLYLSYDGLTDPLGQSQILPYLCGLSKEYSITIISFEKKDRFIKDRIMVENLCIENSIHWRPLLYHKSPPVLSTLYDLWRLRKQVELLHKKRLYKIIHCRSYITSLVGLWAKGKFKVKFIFDMRGFWADERVDGRIWNLRNPLFKLIYSYFKKKERDFISNADSVISLTENAKEEMLSWGLTNKIDVIPCCVDLDLFDPAKIDFKKKEALRASLSIKHDDFVLLYLGSLGTWYLLSEMLEFFRELKKVKSTAKFLFVTRDEVDVGLFEFKQDIIVRHASRKSVPDYISLATGAVVFITPAFSKKASSATKSAEILAMGIPVLSNTGWGDVTFYENKIPGFLTVSMREQFPVAVENLVKGADSSEIRKKASEYFSLSHGIAIYASVYARLK